MTIRPAAAADWPRVGELAGLLVRMHHQFDPSRFVHPRTLGADAYIAHLHEELGRGGSMVHVAEDGGQIVGYVFAGIEPESWKELRQRAGYIHDLVVDEAHRRLGVGRALVASALDWFAARGVRQTLLWSGHANAAAQRLFLSLGFRPTMIEMTRDQA
jgi:ribosomal protein S18 acetylase RimI-like enzyme